MRAIHREKIQRLIMYYETQHLTHVFPTDLMRGTEIRDTNRVFCPTTGKYNKLWNNLEEL